MLPDNIAEEDKEKIYGILGQAVCRPAGIQVSADLFAFKSVQLQHEPFFPLLAVHVNSCKCLKVKIQTVQETIC